MTPHTQYQVVESASMERQSGSQPRLVSRFRSVPSRQPYVIAVVLVVLHGLGIVATITTCVSLMNHPTMLAGKVLIGTIAYTCLFWFASYMKRRSVRCPLCKGSPLFATGALVHPRAKRFLFFSHALTAILSIIFKQQFCCMYCGSSYDLTKDSTRHSEHQALKPSSNNLS